MPKIEIHISEEEKTAIKQYFNHFKTYAEYQPLPNGTKLTRLENKDIADDASENATLFSRSFIVPISENENCLISMDFVDFNDSISPEETHAAIYVNGDFIYLQNKLDASIEEQANEEETDEESDDEIMFNMPNTHQYIANDDFGMRPKVKYGITDTGDLCIYKTRYVYKMDEDGIASPPFFDVSQFAPDLYLYCGYRERKKKFISGTACKQIEIMRFVGENGWDFLEKNILTDFEKDYIAYAMLTQVQEAHARGIVHTDIKLENFCIIRNDDDKKPFTVTLVDWTEAFFIRNDIPNNRGYGKGTVGYKAPEIFIKPLTEPFADKEALTAFCENQETNNETIEDQLKPQYSALLSQQSDLFALGCVLIRDMELTYKSRYYALAWELCHTNPEARPDLTKEEIQFVNATTNIPCTVFYNHNNNADSTTNIKEIKNNQISVHQTV